MNDIIVYTQNDCPPCKIIKMFLDDYGIAYTEKNINTDDLSRRELTEVYGSYSTPTIIVGKEIVTGFDLEKLKQILEIQD